MRKIVVVLMAGLVVMMLGGCVAMNEMRYHPQTWYLLFAPYSAERTDKLIAQGYEAFEKGKYAKAYAIYNNAEVAGLASNSEGAPEPQLATDEYFTLPYAISLLNIRKYDIAAARFNSVLRNDPDNERASAGLMLAQQLEVKKSQQTESMNDLLASLDSLSSSLQQLQPASSQAAQASTASNSPAQSLPNYQAQYDRFARLVEGNVSSLTKMTFGSVAYRGLMATMRANQRDMKRIREEAFRNGINVPQSPWENA